MLPENIEPVLGRVTLKADDLSECDACAALNYGKRCDTHRQNDYMRAALVAAAIPWRYRQCSVDSWDPIDPTSPERTARNTRNRDFIRSWALSPQGFVGLCGPSGTGKTHMLSAVCWLRVLQGLPVSYVSGPDVMAELVGDHGVLRDGLRKFIDKLEPGRLLVFDDLGWRSKSADVEIYRTLVNACYDGEMPLLWATNHLPATLPVDGPTLSRLKSGLTLPFVGRDRRQQ